jgi:hypothetical protein
MGEDGWKKIYLILAVFFTLCAIIPSAYSGNYICIGVCNSTITSPNASLNNLPPIFDTVAAQEVLQGSLLTFPVNASDPDNDISYFISDIPLGSNLIPLGANVTFNWVPDYSQSGSYYANFTVVDTGGLTDTINISIEVIDVGTIQQFSAPDDTPVEENLPPILEPIGNKTATWNTTLNFTCIGIDPEGRPLSFNAGPIPEGSSIDPDRGIFTWTPNESQKGIYFINFTLTDDSGLSDSEVVRINITDIDLAPILKTIGNKTINENSTIYIELNAMDPEGDGLTYNAYPLPIGSQFDRITHMFSWTPGYNQHGVYHLNFTVTDSVLTDYENISITVLDIRAPPILDEIGNKSVNAGLPLIFDVNATDPDEDAIIFGAEALPERAIFNSTTGAFSWIPGYIQEGTYYINFTVSDNMGLMDYETITIIVNPPAKNPGSSENYAPIFNQVSENNIVTGPVTYPILFNVHAMDFDTPDLLYSAKSLPLGAVFDSLTGTFSWTPVYGSNGVYTAEFTVTDGNTSDILHVVLNVTEQPMPVCLCSLPR